MAETNDLLMLCSLAPEQHAKTCDYWYTVTTRYAQAHTAFRTPYALQKWLQERNLEIVGQLPNLGIHSVHHIAGVYQNHMRWDLEEFNALERALADTQKIRVLSNGQYTLGLLTKNTDGMVCVNYLNPNVHERVVFDYWESRALEDGASDAELDISPSQVRHRGG